MATLEQSALSNQPEPSPPAETPAATARGEYAVLATVILATMLAPLNSTMIAVALPRVTHEFAADLTTSGWLITSYLIVMASLQPVAGKLGDRLGRRRLILGGLLYFGLVSLGAARASSLAALLFFRVQQAIAGAIVLPNGAALVREVTPMARRASRFGLIGSAVGLAAAVGPPVGGWLVEVAGWRSLFYVNLLFVLPALFLGLRSLPAGVRQVGRAFDLAGALLLLLLLSGTAVLLTQSRQSSTLLVPSLGGGLLLAAALLFFRREWRHPEPVLQPHFFRNRTFAASNAAIALSNLAMYSTLLALPLLLADQPGWSSGRVGLVLTSLSASMVVLAPLGGRLADCYGRRWPAVGGLALLTLGLLFLVLAGEHISFFGLATGLGVAGTGLGLSSAGLQTAAIEVIGKKEAGVAAGVFSTSRYLGSIVGSSALPLLCHPGDGRHGFTAVFLLVSVAAFLSTLAGLGLQSQPAVE